jgi:hypothetical protein
MKRPPVEPRARKIPLLDAGLEAIRRSDITPLDQYMWDIPFLIGRATRIARDESVRAIVVNADPWSGLVVGAAVARRLELPLIADLRDPWALHPRRQPRRTAITRAAVLDLERRLLRRANRIVLNTEHCAAAYRDHYAGDIEEERFTFIRNAFDASIYHAPIPSGREGFAIHYFGTVGSGRDPSDFYVGFARFLRELGPAAADVKIVFHGDAGPTEDPRVEELGLQPHIEIVPHAPLRDTLRRLHEADILLLIEGEERSLQLPAKLYDYLAAERPILAVGAHAELADILERTGAGVSTGCGDGPDAVARRLRDLYLGRRDSFVTDDKAMDEFRADAQAMRFRQLLEEIVEEPASPESSLSEERPR